MIKILKYAKKYWYYIIFAVIFLFMQAGSELILPQYTSSIVNNGIQFGGIENAAGTYWGKESADNAKIFMTDEEKAVFDECYSLENVNSFNEDVYVLNDGISKEKMTSLENILEETAAVVSTEEGKKTDISSLTAEDAKEIRNSDISMLSASSSSNVKNTAITYVKAMYENIGVDVNSIQMNYLKNKGIVMAFLAFVAMLASAAGGFCASKIAAGTSRDLRYKVFKKVLGFSNAEMGNFSTASLITRCTNDIQQIQMVTVMMFRIVMFAPVMAVGGIVMALKTNIGLSWIIVLAVAVLFSVVIVLMKLAMPKFKIMQTLVDRLNLVAREILTGISVIRAFSREKHEEKRFDDANTRLMKTQLFTNRVMTFMMPAMMLIMNGTSVLVVLAGAHGAENGTMMVGDIMAFISYAMHIIMSFMFITIISIMLPRAAVAADRVEEVLNVKNEIQNPEVIKTPEKIRGKIEFKNVDFRYSDSEEKVLENISFTAEPGQTTAIIGSTGSGKSSVISLIPRLYDVSAGQVLFDGVDVRDMDLKTLRKHIGFVPQKGILFSGTIKSNILFGAENNEDIMKDAAETAQAEEFILSKEEGYNSSISQGGTNVSGGQKQRLSIARAIAKKPEVYIFDDSFSALDYKTDKMLRAALKEKVGSATVIIVAQRISTILHAEKIIVMDEGKIVGMGTHEELLKNNDVYRQIALSQLSPKELGENA
jgi:ATP-binding cassette, subfamily B, multidrug efflux pump